MSFPNIFLARHRLVTFKAATQLWIIEGQQLMANMEQGSHPARLVGTCLEVQFRVLDDLAGRNRLRRRDIKRYTRWLREAVLEVDPMALEP